MTYIKPLPKVNGDTQPFWEGCREQRLRFQRCKDCGHVRWPPSIICPTCHCSEAEWIEAGGRGKVFSFVVYHQAFDPAFKNDLPYVVAVIELQEGPRLLSNIIGCSHEQVRIDMPVEVTWEKITEEFTLPKFKPLS